MKYAIFLQIDEGEWEYLRESDENGFWTTMSDVLVFDTIEEAEEECKRWNTAKIVVMK